MDHYCTAEYPPHSHVRSARSVEHGLVCVDNRPTSVALLIRPPYDLVVLIRYMFLKYCPIIAVRTRLVIRKYMRRVCCDSLHTDRWPDALPRERCVIAKLFKRLHRRFEYLAVSFVVALDGRHELLLDVTRCRPGFMPRLSRRSRRT
ncbi:hypothetical protein IE81DRAFT_203533 [Ceraceosorus guamensis]|uniref:Uncharacterized protein n=1 Tax=Ceraceosorus guamensis TaxID=1522189 RepID=A0A316VU66_9BASI|nr:hypothetical protein IE81DRAFT_203533 [Ceraceosorus guamensis]PWN40774.1 hypothetical protein IE81DRAFT_203533 [Ceraceosorus guamensis]